MANVQVNHRVVRELLDLQKGSDLSLAVAFEDSNVRHVKALIIGAPGTPYEFGFFEFKISFPTEYPSKPPEVRSTTTNSGSTRFNPNIYSDGKVCLSILGTWPGQRGEEWSSAQGLESVLLSIQSLMSSNPYENEPGFEGTKIDNKDAKEYAAKIHHETLRISVIMRLEECLNIEGPVKQETIKENLPVFVKEMDTAFLEEMELSFGKDSAKDKEKEADTLVQPFADLCKRRFNWYFPTYLDGIRKAIATHGEDVANGVKFPKTRFEHPGNAMTGTYNYSDLEKRLVTIHETIDAETYEWMKAGRQALNSGRSTALSFQNTFKALEKTLKNGDTQLHIDLIDKNPFVWRIVMFGAPMTNLDGGIFKIRMVFSRSFPEEQPRVVVDTPIFHHRVAPDGTLCYFPENPREIVSHIKAISKAINEETPRYDPRAIVNPEAATLFWGSAEQKKIYNRKLRRSAQESSE